MGGFVDQNLYQFQSEQAQDLCTDINLLIDPEAAHIAVTAAFPDITIAGNVASDQYLSQTMLDRITNSSDNPYAQILRHHPITDPLWDETAAAIMAYPELVTHSVEAYMDVNTAFDSPDFGRAHLWTEKFHPAHTRKVKYVLSIDQESFFGHVERAVISPKSCE